MIGIGDYCTFNLQYSLGSALLVAVSLCTPQDCPPLMGRLREVSTVRDFWGKFWRKCYLLGGTPYVASLGANNPRDTASILYIIF
jgi:hypothetical protein